MWPEKGRGTILWVAGVLLLALVALAGCAEVEVVDSTPPIGASEPFISPPPSGAARHNLAVLAVDFDPPLDYQQLIRKQSVALLVAVENTGDSTERNVVVHAQLTTPQDADLLLTQGASVVSIAPGEIQVVRFERLGTIPFHRTYRLEVRVDPREGETDLGDNVKAFDIQIHQTQKEP